MYRQVSQNTSERGRLPDPKARDQISDLKNFKENFVLGEPGPVSLPTATSHTEQRLSSDRGSYNQQPYQGQATATVSVSANPSGVRDQNNKQSSPKQNTPAGHATHGNHHAHPYAQHGPEINIAGNRVHSRSPPTPSTSSKGLTVPTVPNNSGFFLVDFIFKHRNVIIDIQNVKAIAPKTTPIELRSSRTSMILSFFHFYG